MTTPAGAKEMKQFLEALADLDSHCGVVSSLDRDSISTGLATFNGDIGNQFGRILSLFESIERDFSIIRQKLTA